MASSPTKLVISWSNSSKLRVLLWLFLTFSCSPSSLSSDESCSLNSVSSRRNPVTSKSKRRSQASLSGSKSVQIFLIGNSLSSLSSSTAFLLEEPCASSFRSAFRISFSLIQYLEKYWTVRLYRSLKRNFWIKRVTLLLSIIVWMSYSLTRRVWAISNFLKECIRLRHLGSTR